MNMDVINNTSVKEVVLIRHGKPLSAHNDKVNSAQYAQWVRNYDKSILDPTEVTQSKKTHIDDSYIVVSPLLRAKLSAAYYGATQIDEELPYLKEMDIPYYKLPFTLRSWHWVVLSRALWFIGFKGRFESFKACQAKGLILFPSVSKNCGKHERIVLFGHGMTNYYTRNHS